jgi:uncharacterized membrane protein
MADTNAPLPLLPAHIEETIRSIARLHARHHQNATPIQRVVDRATDLLGRPRFIGVLTVIAAGWISLNLLAAALGYRPPSGVSTNLPNSASSSPWSWRS